MPLFIVYLFQLYVLELAADSTVVRVVATAFWISVVYASLHLVKVIVFEQAPENTWRYRASSLFQDLMRLLLIIIGAGVVLSVVWQQNLGALVAALGVGSIVLGLALQETLGNLMSGIALLFEKPFTIGDWIQVGEQFGRVEEINWRSVHVRTRERNLLVLPNSVLGRENITNFSRPTSRQILRLSIAFGLEDPPSQVKQILEKVAQEMPGVLEEPASEAYAMEVEDDRIRYEAFLHIDASAQRIPRVRDDFYSRVWYMARRQNLHLPMPVAVEIKRNERPEVEHWMHIATLLAQSEGFRTLPADDLEILARSCRTMTYGQGEVLIAQGEVAQGVYVVADGQIAVDWDHENTLATLNLGHGCALGISSLARGEASTVCVHATTDTEVIHLPHDAVAPLLQRHTRLAVELARIQEQRLATLNRLHREACQAEEAADQADAPMESSEAF